MEGDNKILVCEFQKSVPSKLYYIENARTRGVAASSGSTLFANSTTDFGALCVYNVQYS